MMCDNLSLYKTYIPSPTNQLTTIAPQFYPTNDADDDDDDDEDEQHRPYMSIKRKLSGTSQSDKKKDERKISFIFKLSFTDILSTNSFYMIR